jgi:hypothetical protein
MLLCIGFISVYQTGSYASYKHNDISMGKIFSFPNPHFRSDFTLRVRVVARGALSCYCQCLLQNSEAGPIHSATEIDQLR